MADINDLERKRAELDKRSQDLSAERVEFLSKAQADSVELSAADKEQDDKRGQEIANLRLECRKLSAEIGAAQIARENEAYDSERQARSRGPVEPEPQPVLDFEGALSFRKSKGYERAFRSYLIGRRGEGDFGLREFRNEVRQLPGFAEFRALGRDDAGTGAPIVPRNFLDKLVTLLPNASPLIGEIGSMTIDGDKEFAVETGAGTAAYRNPGEAYAGTDLALTGKNVTICDLGKIMQVDEELIDDSGVNLEEYLLANFALVFGYAMEDNLINGTDAKGPLATTGIKGASGVSTYETASNGVVVFDDLINLRAEIKVAGRAGAKWCFHPTTEAALMLLKDGDDRPLWTPSYAEGVPGNILGQPYVLSDYMPEIANGAKAVFYGNFNRFITNYIRATMMMRRLPELYAATGRIGFRGSFRHDIVLDLPSAIGVLSVNAP